MFIIGPQPTLPPVYTNHMRRILLVLLLLTPLRAETNVETPFLGIIHITRTEDTPRKVSIHILKIDLAAPGLAFKLTEPGGSRETIRQTTLAYLSQERAQAAINVHFFTPYPSPELDSFLIGYAAAQGKVISAFEKPEQSYAIVTDAPAIAIDDGNRAAIVHRDPAFDDGLHILEAIKPWVAISGSAQVITSGARTVPKYGEGELLTPGGPAGYSNERSWYDIPNARTLAALTEDNLTLLLLTVDRAAGSLGLTVGEAADILIADYGAYNGLNLDGGGSTTLAIEDPSTHEGKIVNTPSGEAAGRSVASNLAIFAKPVVQ